MSKTVSIGKRPTARPSTEAIDKWMEGKAADGAGDPTPPPVVEKVASAEKVSAPKMKRLTIDIPDSLHRRVKSRCGQDGLRMADVIRDLLDQRFPESL
jgi:hypothetical protein